VKKKLDKLAANPQSRIGALAMITAARRRRRDHGDRSTEQAV
jgi:hypothetical protein